MIFIAHKSLITFPPTTDTEDYIGLTAHRLVFTPAALRSATRRQCVNIPIIDDTLAEQKERFFVKLQSDPRMPGSMLIGINSTAAVTIKDDDTPGT